MKRLIITSVSILLTILAVVPVAQAKNYDLSPFNLVNLARNGYLTDYGVPRFNSLSFEYRQGRISAADLVQAAIDDNRISSDVLEDQRYIRAVDRFLNDLDSQGDHG
jgi:hypothetical protein